MLTRRQLLVHGARSAVAAALLPAACAAGRRSVFVNDVHSRLNRTPVAGIVRPESVEALAGTVRAVIAAGQRLCVAGGRHAMGGQQFARGALLLDTNGLDQVVAFDPKQGWIDVGAGIQWPALVRYLIEAQRGAKAAWGIAQKQTGADRLSLGGALAANAHGRGLQMPPISGDVESFTLVDARGELRHCSRAENEELFRAAIGGYGLFGAIATLRLRLARRRKLERVVELVDLADLMRRFDERTAEGFVYGDCQYETALDSEGGLRRGVFSCYRPVPDQTPVPGTQESLDQSDWRELVLLAHLDPARAFDAYASYYLATSGQIYWSDTHQMSTYLDDYHHQLASRLGSFAGGSEMISELYVPRDALVPFMEGVRRDFRERRVPLVYGTIRLIERDADSFLPWARERWACVIVNLHTAHDREALARTANHFRRLIDWALRYDGSYFLTYHRFAGREQVLAAHPRFPEFLARKRRLDPEETFTSDWYTHHDRLIDSGRRGA